MEIPLQEIGNPAEFRCFPSSVTSSRFFGLRQESIYNAISASLCHTQVQGMGLDLNWKLLRVGRGGESCSINVSNQSSLRNENQRTFREP